MSATVPSLEGLTIAKIGCEKLIGKGGFALTSPAFEDGGMLDPSFTAQEEDAVAPPLDWTAPPPLAQELVLVVECPETQAVHWLVWGLPAQRAKLMEGEVPPRVGKNTAKNSEWLLPNPKEGDGRQRYVFQMFAVDLPLVLMPGASHKQLLKELENHVVSCAVLTAEYEYVEDEDWDDVDIDDIDFDGN